MLIWLRRQSTSLVRTRSPVRIRLSAPEKEDFPFFGESSFCVCCRAEFDLYGVPEKPAFWGEEEQQNALCSGFSAILKIATSK